MDRYAESVFRTFFSEALASGGAFLVRLQHAFQFVDRVIFLIGADNIRSQTAVMQIGGVLAGCRQDATGQERVVFEITQAQMNAGR